MDCTLDRRALHEIPELDRDLPETLAYIKNVLASLPCKVFSPAESSLCAFFDFGKPTSIAFRTDMDALPCTEVSGVPFSSKHPGKMHACGHDGHMSMVLALAKRAATVKTLPHNLLLVFQPAEETTGGAKNICDSGVFTEYKTEAIFGMHVWPDLPLGKIASIPGGMMCRSSELTVDVTGKASHVARAALGKDALEAAGRFYVRAMDFEKTLPASEPRLLKFGKLEAGNARNVLAESAHLEGTLRAFRDDIFDRLKNGIAEIAKSVEAETGCTFRIHYSEGYPAVWNPEDLLSRVEALANIERLPAPALIAEDFSWYQRYIPGLFLFLGCGPAPALHSPDFHFDEKALDLGSELYWTIAENF